MSQHKRPCKVCPWRKDSANGWLGAATPVEFLQTSEAEHRMPCHNMLNYDQDDWQEQAKTSPQCAGRAVHFANRCKKPRSPELLTAEPDRELVFSSPQDFIDHHSRGIAPRVMILGAQVTATTEGQTNE